MANKGHRGWQFANVRAARKLDRVVARLCRATDGGVVQAAYDPAEEGAPAPSKHDGDEGLHRLLATPCCPEVDGIVVRYVPRSTLFAILYDFTVEFDVLLPLYRDGSHDEAAAARELRIDDFLGNELIATRAKALDVVALRASFDEEKSRCHVEFSTMVGSSTWNLIPPVMQLIEPTDAECLRLIELVRLLAVAVQE